MLVRIYFVDPPTMSPSGTPPWSPRGSPLGPRGAGGRTPPSRDHLRERNQQSDAHGQGKMFSHMRAGS